MLLAAVQYMVEVNLYARLLKMITVMDQVEQTHYLKIMLNLAMEYIPELITAAI
jgi:hypothetical protein